MRDSLAAWSPTGDLLATYSNRSGDWDIWLVPVAGNGQPRRLTNWESNEIYPSWSPDGRTLAFCSNKNGNADIWLIDADGKNARLFEDGPAEEAWSAWSPDGRWFYFSSNRSGSFNIWVKPAAGGEARQLTDYASLSRGLPDSALFTKFAVTRKEMIIPIEIRRSDIYILETGVSESEQ